MRIVTFLIILLSATGIFAQKISVFENAPYIDAADIQQMKNFAEFGDSYFYTSTSFATNSQGDNVLVRVNKNSGVLESIDQKKLSIVTAWLTATDKYIYYPYFDSKNGTGFYKLNRYDPKTNIHETIKNERGEEAFLTSSILRQAGFYSYKDFLVVTGTTEGIKSMPYSKHSTGLFPDSAAFLDRLQIGYFQGPQFLFYTPQVPTTNTLTINPDGLYFFAHNPTSSTYRMKLIQTGSTENRDYALPGGRGYLPVITSNDDRMFTLSFGKDDFKGELVTVHLLEFAKTVGTEVASLPLDRLSIGADTQLAMAGDSVFISDRWRLYEYNFKLKTIKEHLKLKPNERFYNVQNGKRFHFAPDGTIFYKKMTYDDRNETIGRAFVFAFDKTTAASKQLFETKSSSNGDDLLKMHNARNNTYFIGSKAIDFKLNPQADKLDVLIYDKNGAVTNLAMPQIKKFKPHSGWYDKYFTAIQSKDAVIFNYGYQKDKKEEKIVVMKISE